MDSIENKTGIYIAYPTSSVLKSIFRAKNYKAKVNNEHTKIGIAKDSFKARKSGYLSNFDNEVAFIPLVIISDIKELTRIEKLILSKILFEFSRVGRAREWFLTNNHKRIKEIIMQCVINDGVKHFLTNHTSGTANAAP